MYDFWGARRARIIGTNLCAKNANRVARKSSAASRVVLDHLFAEHAAAIIKNY
jgi:hypothetical protein